MQNVARCFREFPATCTVLPPYKPRKSGGSGIIARPSCGGDRAAVVTRPSKILHGNECIVPHSAEIFVVKVYCHKFANTLQAGYNQVSRVR